MPDRRVTPSVLLVHGAFADTSLWTGVIAALRRRTIDAVAVANPLSGLRRDAAYVASLAAAIDGPVLLAGQGYAGAVIGVTAAACANVIALVYVAAFVPDEGESCIDLIGRSPDPRPIEALQPAIVQRDDGPTTVEAAIRRDAFHEIVAGDLPTDDAAVAAASQRPVVAGALEEPAPAAPGWRTRPSWYVVAGADRLIPPDIQRFMAQRAGARIVELDGSHAIARVRPDEIAEVIADAARGNGG